jgi:hypothetical protein
MTVTGVSNGSRMLTPKLFSAPAPSIPAFMIPKAAPVTAMNLCSVIRRPKSEASL